MPDRYIPEALGMRIRKPTIDRAHRWALVRAVTACSTRLVMQVAMLVAGAAMAAAVPPMPGPALTVDVIADRHPINPDVYGVNMMLDEALARELRLPVRRWGGNYTSRYNWQNDTANVAFDWYFENIPQDNANPATLPDGSTTDRFVEQDRRTATRTLVTVPMIGWVPKRRLSGHPYDCSFKVSKYGAQQSTDPWDADCGNGRAPNGSALTGNDPADTSVAVDPSFVSAWINHLVAKYGTAANGGVAYYALDNEPMLWGSTHRDVHPQAVTYDELRDRSYQYGAAIKAADPSAKTFGPVEWGWCAYFYSGADNCSPGADYQAHGSTPFAAWYLQQMRAYEQQHGQRLLDYFDLHAYPYANGVALAAAGDAAKQALRLRSTRSLWDPTYIDESWVSDMAPGGVAVQLIPRMKQWVAANYPGTRLAITEYNWGGFDGVNGALAQADVLGIFGREGLDLATLWGDLTATTSATFAFRMYRNYDGAGNGFGDIGVRSSSADQGVVSVYSAQRSVDGALTIMVINKSGNDLATAVGLAGFNPRASAAAYRYSQAYPAAIEHLADQPVTASGFSANLPANSITLFVLPAANATLTRSPASLAFDGQSINTSSPARTLTIGNAGGSAVTRLALATATPFAVTHDCGASLAAGASCTARVTFTPTHQGDVTGSLSIVADGIALDATLTGNGERSLATHYYQSILRRAPDPDGKAYWDGVVATLPTWGASLNETWYAMASFFYSSNEYRGFARDDTGFVTDLYRTFFNRAPDAEGLRYWVAGLGRGMPREVVLVQFMFSPEFAAFTQAIFGNTPARAEVDVVMDFYRGLLGRLPDRNGFDHWLGQIRAAQCQSASAVTALVDSISQQFLNGSEYAGRARSNGQFVGDLYNAFLRRGGDEAGVAHWIDQLNLGSLTRDQERSVFLGSGEFAGRVAAVIAEGCLR